jgi:hypothetical protein
MVERFSKSQLVTAPDLNALWDAYAALYGYANVVAFLHQEPSGTHGGTFTAGDWRTRPLNVKLWDADDTYTLASNQVTLPAGVYHVRAMAAAYAVQHNRLRLRDVTNGVTLLEGLTLYSAYDVGLATLEGTFELEVEAALELQHRGAATISGAGFGAAASGGFGTPETYAMLVLHALPGEIDLSAVDHGALGGLDDDDHPQYLNEARGDARYSLTAHDHDGDYEAAGYADGLLTAHTTTYNHAAYNAHLGDTTNPHEVNKTDVGLGNVDNTSDAAKPLSAAAIAALAGKAAVDHDHDTDYAPIVHDHDADYAPIVHDHDADYAAIDHDHAGVYAPVDHNHDADYAAVDHDHDADYAAIGHDHDGDYAPIVHDHDGEYDPAGAAAAARAAHEAAWDHGTFLLAVTTDVTLTGTGTIDNPLRVAASTIGGGGVFSRYATNDIDLDGDTIYIGKTPTAAGDGEWVILRLVTTGDDTVIRYASGAADYATNWTGRAALTYVRAEDVTEY